MHRAQTLTWVGVVLVIVAASVVPPQAVESPVTVSADVGAGPGQDAGPAEPPAHAQASVTPPAEGLFRVFLTDGPTDDVQNVIVSLDGVDVHAGGAGWQELAMEFEEVDLLSLQGGVTELMAFRALPVGFVTQLRLRLVGAHVVVNDQVEPVTIPSGFQTGIKIQFSPPVRIEAGRATTILLDFDLEKSLHRARGHGWIMPPTISVVSIVTEPVFRMDPAQLEALQLLELESSEPVEFRLGEAFTVPELLAGRFPTDPAARTPADQATSFLLSHEAIYRLDRLRDGFAVLDVRTGRLPWTNVRLQQTVDGVPVFGAEQFVHIDRNEVILVHGTYVPGITIGTVPRLDAAAARAAAEADLRAGFPGVQILGVPTERLAVYNPRVLEPSASDVNVLSWQFVFDIDSPPGQWYAFVDADTGAIVDAWDNSMDAHPSQVWNSKGDNVTSNDDLWYEDHVKQITGSAPAEASEANSHGDFYYDYLLNNFGLDSLNGAGVRMIAFTNYLSPGGSLAGNNACWSCGGNNVKFNPGMVNLDVLSHEFTHGLVAYSGGGLVYQRQSGAMNEAFADSFAEYVDCQIACNWLIGKDGYNDVAMGGIIRSLADPTLYNDPDHMKDFLFAAGPCDKTNDKCYVHSNSGIPNKVAYLMAVGGTHYGITVTGIGVSRAGQVLFSTLVDAGLSSTAKFAEERDVMLKVCVALVGSYGITLSHCRQVFRAWCSVGLCHLTQAMAGAYDEMSDHFGQALASGDFNGDGREDLAVGVLQEDYNGKVDTGAVMVYFGSVNGLGALGAEVILQQHAGTSDEDNDRFGWSLAAGDFNGNGYDDLAVGVPFESLGSTQQAGIVHVFYGSAYGLLNGNTASVESLSENGLGATSETNDRFGWSLAAGNFDGDAYDDLVVGTPNEDFGVVDAGFVDVFYGSSSGLLLSGSPIAWERLDQALAGGVDEAADRFGFALATGNFNGDAYDDLAVGTPYEDQGSIFDAGHVNVLYGSGSGLLPATPLVLNENVGGGSTEPYDHFGWSLSTGDFDADGYDDLAVGSPDENLGSIVDAGILTVFYGSGGGLWPTVWVRITQAAAVPFNNDANDRYTYSLAAGDFDADGYDDVVVSVPWSDFSSLTDAGSVFVYHGSGTGLWPIGTLEAWTQVALGADDESYDRMGYSLAVGDFDGSGTDDLAMGAPWENPFTGKPEAGAVYIAYY